MPPPLNESELARGAGSDNDSFGSWLRLRAQDDEPRKAGRERHCIGSTRDSPLLPLAHSLSQLPYRARPGRNDIASKVQASRLFSLSPSLQSREGSYAIPRQDRHRTFRLSSFTSSTSSWPLETFAGPTGAEAPRPPAGRFVGWQKRLAGKCSPRRPRSKTISSQQRGR
jgi:hypothetical protein